jgi:citrate synthase
MGFGHRVYENYDPRARIHFKDLVPDLHDLVIETGRSFESLAQAAGV